MSHGFSTDCISLCRNSLIYGAKHAQAALRELRASKTCMTLYITTLAQTQHQEQKLNRTTPIRSSKWLVKLQFPTAQTPSSTMHVYKAFSKLERKSPTYSHAQDDHQRVILTTHMAKVCYSCGYLFKLDEQHVMQLVRQSPRIEVKCNGPKTYNAKANREW
eukprot:4857494-Amphidinium_carterae.1